MNSWDQLMASAEEAYRAGDQLGAQKLWMQAVKEAEQANDMRRAGVSLDRMADALRQNEHYADAQFVLEMAVEVKTDVYGAEHFEVIGTLNNLVDTMHAQRRYDEALPMVRMLLRAYQVTFGVEHPGAAAIAVKMAHLYSEIDNPHADEFFEQALVIKTKTLGFTNDEVRELNNQFAAYLYRMGREADAKQVLENTETVSGVWKTVAAKMAPTEKLSDGRTFFDKRRDQRRRELK
jgi:tetratricopeptide (TPR) repeat protein